MTLVREPGLRARPANATTTAEGIMSRRLAGLLALVSIGILASCTDQSPTDSKPSHLGVPNLPGGVPTLTSLTPAATFAAAPLANDIIPCVGGETVLLIQDVVPWGYLVPKDQDPLGADVTELKAQDKNFCMIHSADIDNTDLSQFKEIIIPAVQDQNYYDNLFPGTPVGVFHKAITKWVMDGGVLSANLAEFDPVTGFGNWEGKV